MTFMLGKGKHGNILYLYMCFINQENGEITKIYSSEI